MVQIQESNNNPKNEFNTTPPWSQKKASKPLKQTKNPIQAAEKPNSTKVSPQEER
jgi:hypothetical protein